LSFLCSAAAPFVQFLKGWGTLDQLLGRHGQSMVFGQYIATGIAGDRPHAATWIVTS
jgi:hypothetical protein